MELKVLTETDYQASIELSSYAFQYTVPTEDIPKVKERLRDHHVVGLWDDIKLAAKLHIIPLHIVMNGQHWKMGGIAGVATFPEYRRKGLVNELMAYSINKMKEEGQIVSLLHPFKISFYRKYGWEVFTENRKLEIESSFLKMTQPITGNIRRFSKEDHHSEIESLYQVYCNRYNGMLVRDEIWWKNSVYSDAQIALYYNEEMQAKGYILYNIKDRVMDIHEIVSLDQNARVQLWNYICQHDSMVDKVKILLSVHEPFLYYLSEPKVKNEVEPYFMARIVDAKKCLEQYCFIDTKDKVIIHLEDEFAKWNNGTYFITTDEIKSFNAKEGSYCQHPPNRGLTMNINTLSAILFGYKRPIELFEMDFIKGNSDEVKILDNKIPRVNGFFYDYF
ncbi:enhanced intracellular survival protein Eis [Bacillus sp. CGMCC 1.16607]|uniref:GNAT family N-acetyltransferase n=1 Tax=Bacillus sp. CGMCC 1.16607 TaxID=3351842 RepID=UPI0036394A3E